MIDPLVREFQDECESLKAEVQELKNLEWLARDFVWCCPNIPEHPTAQRLVDYFTRDGVGE